MHVKRYNKKYSKKSVKYQIILRPYIRADVMNYSIILIDIFILYSENKISTGETHEHIKNT